MEVDSELPEPVTGGKLKDDTIVDGTERENKTETNNHNNEKNENSTKEANHNSASNAEEDEEEEEDEEIMWKCAKCPLEFPDRDGVIQHVKAVHKKADQPKKESEDKINNLPASIFEKYQKNNTGDDDDYEYDYQDNNDHDDDDDDDQNSGGLMSPPSPPRMDESDPDSDFPSSKRAKRSEVPTKRKVGRPPSNNSTSRVKKAPVNNRSNRKIPNSDSFDSTESSSKPWATPKLSCEVCHFQVSSSSALQRHLQANTFRPRIWKCAHCIQTFVYQSDADSHLASKHPDEEPDVNKTWECDTCDQSYGDQYELAHHQQCHKIKSPWKCACCERSFERMCTLKLHEDAELNKYYGGGFKCIRCTEVFLTKTEMANHQKHTHTSPMPCDLCDKVFNTVDSWQRHKNSHMEEKPWKCTICGDSFQEKVELNDHAKELHGEEDKSACSNCGKSFRRAAALKQHELICLKIINDDNEEEEGVEKYLGYSYKAQRGDDSDHGGSGDSDFKLSGDGEEEEVSSSHSSPAPSPLESSGEEARVRQPVKSKKSSTASYRNTGNSSRNSQQGGYPCNVCGKSMASTKSLKRHLLIHTRDKRKVESDESDDEDQRETYDCSYCSESFPLPQSLEWHELTVHEDGKKYGCKYCSDRFVAPSQLKAHVISKHAGSNQSVTITFKCSICGKVFSKREYLRIHAKCHAGEKRFKCSQFDCDEAFFSPQARNQHLLKVHGLTEQVFKCKNCESEFETQRELERHELTHDNDESNDSSASDTPPEKLHKCSTCDKSFHEEFLLKMHEKEHEPNQSEFKCEHCDKKFKSMASRNMHGKKAHPESVKKAEDEITLE